VPPSAPVMESTSSTVKDGWSVPGESHRATGGGTQRYIPHGSGVKEVPPPSAGAASPSAPAPSTGAPSAPAASATGPPAGEALD
jgi:hypothetical protein